MTGVDRDILIQADEQVLAVARKLREGYQLKRTLRYGTARDMSVHSESVAEHVFALCYLLNYFLPLEDPEGKMDRAKIYDMLVFHDFGEILGGDVPYHVKTEEHEQNEQEDALKIFNMLPSGVGEHGKTRWEEFEVRESREAKFVYALDKIEPLFELYDPVNEKSMQRLHFTLELSKKPKIPATEDFPTMRRFVDVLHADMERRGVFCLAE